MNQQLMETADFLPFVNHNIAEIHASLVESSEKILGDPQRSLSRRDREAARPRTLAWLWRGRALHGFFAEHYALGSVFDVNGVKAMVDSVGQRHTGLARVSVVNAYVRMGSEPGLTRLEISEEVALALVWRKHGLLEDQ